MRSRAPFSPLALLVALVFGLAAYAVVRVGWGMSVAGTPLLSDPRSLLVAVGSALTGPVGGLIAGAMAGYAEPVSRLPSMVGHIAGGVWLGFVYRRVIVEHLQMPAGLVVWVFLVAAYYFVFRIPGTILGGWIAAGLGFESEVGNYFSIASGLAPEVGLTALVSSVFLAFCPSWCRRGIW